MRTLRAGEKWLLVLSVIVALVCVRLGVWQLSRLSERRAKNAFVLSRLTAQPVSVARLPRDSAGQHYARVKITGTYDYDHGVRLTGRTREGSPGVNLVTPVRLAGNDTAVLVNRGWIYAPDGVVANPAPWREGDSVDAIGYVVPFTTYGQGAPSSPRDPRALRWLDTTVARSVFPYPVYPYVVVLQGDVKVAGGVLPRVIPPPLDEGPHASYAFQWFAFATIAVAGAYCFVRFRPR